MHQLATQRAGIFSEVPGLLREAGVAPNSIFAGSSIDPETLTAESRIPFPAALQVLDRASKGTGLPHFGLLLGSRFNLLKHHGAIGRLMMSAPTLERALLDFVSWQPGYSSGAIVYFEPWGEEYAFGYATLAASSPGAPVLYDTVMVIAARMLDFLSGGCVKPIDVRLSRNPPDSLSEYQRLLPYPKAFNQSRTCVTVKNEEISKPLETSDAVGRQFLLKEIERVLWPAPPSLSQRVNHSLRHILHYNKPTMSAVAKELGFHPRTLRRQLAKESTSYETLLDEVRFSVATEFLAISDIPLGEIGAILGFSCPSVFSESFRRKYGCAPSTWRKKFRMR